MAYNLDELIGELKELSEMFYKDKEREAFAKLAQMIKTINEVMAEFINKIPKYNEKGADIPADVVLAQLNNLVEAMKYKDTVMLGDCIRYELIESISLYKELLMEKQYGNV